MLKVFPLVVAAGLVAGPALAQTAASSAPAMAAQAPAKEKKICHSLQATGSIMPTKTCHTKAEWAAIDAANQANAQNALDHRNGRLSGQF